VETAISNAWHPDAAAAAAAAAARSEVTFRRVNRFRIEPNVQLDENGNWEGVDLPPSNHGKNICWDLVVKILILCKL
jgi:hypothetical protein